MNLLQDVWIPVIRHDGTREKIRPSQIAEKDNPVVEVDASRPDFQGAIYQFLIGLLQMTAAPEDQDAWEEVWNEGLDTNELSDIFEPFNKAFELLTDTGVPAFMQDLDLSDGEGKSIAALLIESPGGKTLKDNLDHFIKGGSVNTACESCTATALFTLQCNAPSGGVGHRVGLRGGGPLTTLLMPNKPDAELWRKLWLNILTEEDLGQDKLNIPRAKSLPWMAATRVSDKGGVATLPEDADPLQMYWGMPRRIRLETSDQSGICDLCGDQSAVLYSHYRTKNYGVNYEGTWEHPLSPYRYDPKKEKPPLSIKGQPGGLGYRHWLNLVWYDSANGDASSMVVKKFHEERIDSLEKSDDGSELVTLWCFGYDMDNMKARSWYEYTMPVVAVPSYYRPLFIHFVAELIYAANDVNKELRSQVKAGWFKRPKDVKGDTSMVDKSFWESTESGFYKQLRTLSMQSEDIRSMPSIVAEQWLGLLKSQAIKCFDHWVIEGDIEDMDMKRITAARRELMKKLKSLKSLQILQRYITDKSEVA